VLTLLVLTGQVRAEGEAQAIFAGGCFWCVESDFDKVPGVLSTTSGYIGGKTQHPTYKQVSAGGTGHFEAVRIVYDPKTVSYKRLVHIYWRSVDPTDAGGQFCDRGDSYKTAIFVLDEAQRAAAEASKKALQDANTLGAPIVTEIRKAGTFTPAEEYHQDYYRKNPIRYKFYRLACRRDARIESLWGDQAHAGIPHS
jgi:peptide-methionine (S)-S-oxide reductase